jgi:radical SAM protein with 4Fe4S-binding SPASM domain
MLQAHSAKITELKKFSKVNIEISNICNLQCSFCPEVLREKKMMSLELFEKTIQQVAPITELVCLHLMGDPLVHPRLEDLIAICDRYKTKIFFVTNGVLLRAKKMSLLLHPTVQQVNFSLHSFFDNYPAKDPAEYLKRIFEFTELAFAQRPDLYLNYRLWNLNDPSGSQTDNRLMLNLVCEHFKCEPPTQVNVRKQKSIHIKNRLYLHFDTEFTWPSLDLPVLGTSGRCHGLSSHFGVLVDGTVVPCCLDKEAAIPLGQISTTPVLEILSSPRAKEMLYGFRQKKLVEELCQRCQYIERFQPHV